MKLSHLYESVDHRELLKEVARELGWGIHLEGVDAATLGAAIDLFRLHLDTDGSALIRDRLREIEKLTAALAPRPKGMEDLKYLENSSFGQLPAVKAFYQASLQTKAYSSTVRSSAEVALQVYFLLNAVNEAATTTMSSKHSADEVKYRASIARACMKQLGMTPKDL